MQRPLCKSSTPRYLGVMAEIINLNKFRKARARADEKAQAEENAVKFGRTKAQKKLEAAQTEKSERDLDGKERSKDPE